MEQQLAVRARVRRRGWWVAIAGVSAGLVVRGGGFVLTFRGGGLVSSTAQVAFLFASLMVVGGLVVVVGADRSVVMRGLTAAATLTAGALTLLMWVAVALPYVVRSSLPVGQRAVAQASLAADLGIVVLLVCFFSRRPTATRETRVLGLAVGCHVLTDIAFVVFSAQHVGATSSPHLPAVLGVYAVFGMVILRRARRSSAAADASGVGSQRQGATAFDPLVGVVLVNSVTVVLAALREDRVGALLVAAAALVLTAVAARAQWQLHAGSEEVLAHTEAERARLHVEHESASAAYAAASETLATTSHFLSEMTTRIAGPLNGVLEATDRLHEGSAAAHQPADVAALAKSADVLLSVVNELLGVSEEAAVAAVFVDSDFNLRAAIGAALSSHADAAAAKQLELDVMIDDDVPEMVRGDEQRLRELLDYFVDNAVSYTRRGGVSISVSLIDGADDGEFTVYVAVNDTGVGLSAYESYRAFEPDVRCDPDRRRYRGKARGLTKARALVEKFGGLYGVESELGVGASFWFTVVLHAAAPVTERAAAPPLVLVSPQQQDPGLVTQEAEISMEPEREPEPVPAPEPEREGSKGYLLFAEDDPLCRRITVAALRRAGYRVDTVTNGIDAVTAVADRAYDLVLMDCQLPVMTGLEATVAIRASANGGERLPIIAVSAFTTEKEQREAVAAGMNGFVRKPLDIDELLAVLDRVAGKHVLA